MSKMDDFGQKEKERKYEFPSAKGNLGFSGCPPGFVFRDLSTAEEVPPKRLGTPLNGVASIRDVRNPLITSLQL